MSIVAPVALLVKLGDEWNQRNHQRGEVVFENRPKTGKVIMR